MTRAARGRRAAAVLLTAAALGVLLLAGLRWNRPALAAGISTSSAISARGGELLRLTLAADGQYRLWVPLERMPARLPQAVMLYEDRWFYSHPGVNPIALLRAAVNDARGARRLGASTLTMQLARRLYRLDTRSPTGKLRQMACALWIEARYSKRDILEAYLNLAPYGRNVEGAPAAALVFFGRPVAQLSVLQLMTLAVIPQNPRARRLPDTGIRIGIGGATTTGSSPLADARRRLWAEWVARHPDDHRFDQALDGSGVAAPDVANRGVATPDVATPGAHHGRPYLAPHFTDALLRRSTGDLHTTLDLPRQLTVERVLEHYVGEQSPSGIRNAAALLLEVKSDGTAAIRAYVGSADYRSTDIAGQVNAITAKRSPGSTLKPFVYALALDQGLLHSRTILKDTPSSFGPFSPENFDGRFLGPIAAEDALIRSRNVPAVAVASRLSRPDLYEFLTAAGVSRLQSESHYGLALALGGGEVSMEELARLYGMLLNDGRLPTLQSLVDAPTLLDAPAVVDSPAARSAAPAAPQLLSEEASFITLDMLARNPRPDTGQPALPAVAWKTGTSWGFHDAWSAAVFGRQVLIVWIGNFDNTGNPAFVGVQAAAPLMFRIIDALRTQGQDTDGGAKAAPPHLARIEVCAASGDLPNAECPQTIATWFIPGKSPIRVSDLHRRVYLDTTGRRVCGPGPGIREEVYEFWSSDMLLLFREAGMPRRVPPPAPECGAVGATSAGGVNRDPPRIVSPLRAVVYTLRLADPQPLALRATLGAEARTTFWFAGNAYLGRSAHGETLSWLPAAPGRYSLRAVDDSGATDTRDVAVEVLP